MGAILTAIFEPQNLLAILAAVAIFATIITVSMPMLQKDELGTRMKSVAIERDKIRARERARLAEKENKSTLKRGTESGFSQKIVQALDLRNLLASEKSEELLIRAGFRQPSQMNMFLAAKLILPFVLFFVAIFYTFFVTNKEGPAMINIMISVCVGGLGFYLPQIIVQNKASKRQLSIKRAWPDALDLLLICVESGMSLEASLKKVALEVGIQSPELAEEFTLTTAELSYLQERRQAHENLAKRTGLDIVKAVTMALIQAERYGTPLATALRALSQESRDMRMAEAEKKAASLPPKLTVPMIIFFLPVLFAVIMGPAFIQISSN